MEKGVNSGVFVQISKQNRTMDTNQIYNPVLKDHSAVFDLIRAEVNIHVKRQKRRTISWNCTGLCKQSLCTWREVLDYDNRRRPAGIKKAVCSHKCSFNFTELNLSPSLNVLTTCQPLRKDIPVFQNNEGTYLRDWPIACVCSRKLITTVQKLKNKGKKYQKRKELKRHKLRNKRKKIRRKLRTKLRHAKYTRLLPFLFLPQFK